MVEQNFLIPKHKKINEEEINSLLEKFQINSVSKLPKIKIKDPGIKNLEEINVGDVIEISRNSFAGETKYYREVVE